MDISQIKVGGTTYNLRDSVAREAIAGGSHFIGKFVSATSASGQTIASLADGSIVKTVTTSLGTYQNPLGYRRLDYVPAGSANNNYLDIKNNSTILQKLQAMSSGNLFSINSTSSEYNNEATGMKAYLFIALDNSNWVAGTGPYTSGNPANGKVITLPYEFTSNELQAIKNDHLTTLGVYFDSPVGNSTYQFIVILSEETGGVSSGNVALHRGDIVMQSHINSTPTEFIWDGKSWQELGSTSSIKSLAYKDSASATYTPQGTISYSGGTISGGSSGKLVTTTVKGVSSSGYGHLETSTVKAVNTWSAGTMFSATPTVINSTDGVYRLDLSAGTVPSLTTTSTGVATGGIANGIGDEGDGGTVVTAINTQNTTVATGSITSNGTGATVVTSSPTATAISGLTFNGTTTTITVS